MVFNTLFHLVITNCTKTRKCTHHEQIYEHNFQSKNTGVLLTAAIYAILFSAYTKLFLHLLHRWQECLSRFSYHLWTGNGSIQQCVVAVGKFMCMMLVL